MAEKSRREMIEEAFDEHEADPTGDEARNERGDDAQRQDTDTRASAEGGEVDAGSGGEEQRQDAGAGDGGAGEEVDGKKKDKKDEKRLEQKTETTDEKERKAAADAAKATEQQRGRVSDKPPNSWKPGPRQDWEKIPATARAEINRREQEIQRELSQTATIRKFSQDLAAIVQPHLANLQAQQQAPLQAIDGLLKASSTLYQGNPEQKAREIARIMQIYGVDVRVLDKVLSSAPIPKELVGQAAPAPQAVPQWGQQVLAYINQQQQAEQQRRQALQSEAEGDVEAAQETMPFLNDLRFDVADIMEMAARRGKVMTLEQAYNQAVSLDPEVSKIVEQQKLAAAQKKNGNLTRNRRAAAPISGSPRGDAKGGAGGGKQTRRDQIREAFDELEA